MYENGLMERRTMKVEVQDPDSGSGTKMVDEKLDETAGEVNVSYIPHSAIIGWVAMSKMHIDNPGENNRDRFETLQSHISWGRALHHQVQS